MTIHDRLKHYSRDEGLHVPLAAVPKDFLREVEAHIERIEADRAGEAFDIVGHLSAPSRVNPMASAAAVNIAKHTRSVL